MKKSTRFVIVMCALSAVLAAGVLAGLTVGSADPVGLDALRVLTHGGETDLAVVTLRARRMALAIVVGAALSVAGVALQALLRNPLADPYILGVSGGGALGAAFFTFAAGSVVFVSVISEKLGFSARAVAALFGACAASSVVLFAGRRRGHIMPSTLLLVGVMVNAMCGAAVLALTYWSNPQESHEIVVWLMGNLSTFSLPGSAIVGCTAGIVVFSGLLWRLGARLNVMSLGDEEATHLGVHVGATRVQAFVLAAGVTGLSVALAGPIGFVGLVVPHITRTLVGADHRVLFPAALLFGSGFLVIADTVARIIRPGNPLPVGVITAALGAPFFIWLLRTGRGGGGGGRGGGGGGGGRYFE